jgi:serine/threonine-protein kinase RIO1
LLERVQNAVDLRTLGHIDSPERRLAVIVALGEAVRRMHAAGLFHRELSVRNVLLVNEESPAPPRVLFIDCPRAERASFGLRTDFLRRADLLRLTRSAIKFGASENEASVLLESAGAEHPTTILQHARRSIAVDNSHPLRVNLWMILGI